MNNTLVLTIEQAAQILHSANVTYCQTQDDHSHTPNWGALDDQFKKSLALGVQFHLDNPGAIASSSHDCWLKFKTAEGWTYGPKKNVEQKVHPCMLPFYELPESQQIKDRLFKSIMDVLRPYIRR